VGEEQPPALPTEEEDARRGTKSKRRPNERSEAGATTQPAANTNTTRNGQQQTLDLQIPANNCKNIPSHNRNKRNTTATHQSSHNTHPKNQKIRERAVVGGGWGPPTGAYRGGVGWATASGAGGASPRVPRPPPAHGTQGHGNGAADHLEPRRPSVGHPVGQALGVSGKINALRTLDRSSMIYRTPRSTRCAPDKINALRRPAIYALGPWRTFRHGA